MNNQYKKGVLELCVLSLLYQKDCYGYDISEYLSRHIEIADGTVYPILRKLKSDGYVTTYLSEESGGPPRKYYSLTKSGIDEYLAQKTDWLEFAKAIETLLEGETNHE
jgi:PadR family transcriptional regulator PadR